MSIATLGNVANLHMSCYKTATYLYICPNTNTCQYKGKCCQTTYELVQDTQIQMKIQSLFWWSWKISLGPLDVRYQRWSLKSAVLVRMREVTGFFGGGTNWPLFTNIQDLLRQPGRQAPRRGWSLPFGKYIFHQIIHRLPTHPDPQ